MIITFDQRPVRILVDEEDVEKARALARAIYVKAYGTEPRCALGAEPRNDDPEADSNDDQVFADEASFLEALKQEQSTAPVACFYSIRLREHRYVDREGIVKMLPYVDTYYAALVRDDRGTPKRLVYRELGFTAHTGLDANGEGTPVDPDRGAPPMAHGDPIPDGLEPPLWYREPKRFTLWEPAAK